MHAFLSLLMLLLTGTAPTPNSYIAPGQALGNIRLGASFDSLTWLGPANFGDASMQKAWGTWFAEDAETDQHPHEIDVYITGVAPDLHKEVQMVRATSPYFHTVDGIRVGSTLANIRESCGPFVLATTFTLLPADGPRYLYDNVRAGIAFELDGRTPTSHCTAVVIHRPGSAANSSYLSMTQYLREAVKQMPKP